MTGKEKEALNAICELLEQAEDKLDPDLDALLGGDSHPALPVIVAARSAAEMMRYNVMTPVEKEQHHQPCPAVMAMRQPGGAG